MPHIAHWIIMQKESEKQTTSICSFLLATRCDLSHSRSVGFGLVIILFTVSREMVWNWRWKLVQRENKSDDFHFMLQTRFATMTMVQILKSIYHSTELNPLIWNEILRHCIAFSFRFADFVQFVMFIMLKQRRSYENLSIWTCCTSSW